MHEAFKWLFRNLLYRRWGPRQILVLGKGKAADAIQQVTHIVEDLKRALEEMEEVLETLEFAERQKIDDEREIENLQRALRKLHRPVQPPSQQRH